MSPIAPAKHLIIGLAVCGSWVLAGAHHDARAAGRTADALPLPGAAVIAPDRCSPEIGQGGNLVSGRQALAGKCEGAGTSVRIETEDERSPLLDFRILPGSPSEKDRAELAFTSERLRFGTPTFVGFDVRVPADSAVTRSWFYLLQFWQGGSRPPIAGLRMDRGQSHRASIMARGEGNEKGQTVSRVTLPPDRWVRVVLQLDVNPEGRSCITVWKGADGDGPGEWCGAIGFAQDGTLKNWYRLKFGIYKSSEPDRLFHVQFRSIRIGASLEQVQ